VVGRTRILSYAQMTLDFVSCSIGSSHTCEFHFDLCKYLWKTNQSFLTDRHTIWFEQRQGLDHVTHQCVTIVTVKRREAGTEVTLYDSCHGNGQNNAQFQPHD
jgi:hypothetical protein